MADIFGGGPTARRVNPDGSTTDLGPVEIRGDGQGGRTYTPDPSLTGVDPSGALFGGIESAWNSIKDTFSPETKAIDRQRGLREETNKDFQFWADRAATRNTQADNVAGTVNPDLRNTNQARGMQTTGLGMAHRAAMGEGPSGAALQSAADQDRAMRNSLALSAAGQGRSAGGALTAGLTAGSNAAAQISANAQAERAREMATARGQYMAGANALRTGDQNLATTVADLQLRAAQGDQDAAIRLQQIDDQFALGRGDQLLNSVGAGDTLAINRDAIINDYKGGLISGIASGGAALLGG